MKRAFLPESLLGTSKPLNLPSATTKRWLPGRKAEIVGAVVGGFMTAEEACRPYGLFREEMQTWIVAFDLHGINVLRATLPTRGPMPFRERYELARDGQGWMVVDLDEGRPAIAEGVALNGLWLLEAHRLMHALNVLHRRMGHAVLCHGLARTQTANPRNRTPHVSRIDRARGTMQIKLAAKPY